MFFFQFSMNYVFSLSSGSDSCLYNHTGDVIDAFFSTDVGFEPVRTRRRHLALQRTAHLSTALPKFPLKKEAQIAQIKITAFTVPSV